MSAPLEALAFNYLSFGLFTVVNNIWTWVAVITAAFSFWRIKTSSTFLKPASVRSGDHDASLSPPQTVFVPVSGQVGSLPVINEPPSTSTTVTSFDKEMGGTKGRFTAYFEQDDIIGSCMDHHISGDKNYIDKLKILSQSIQNAMFLRNGVEEETELCEEWYENWEKVIRTRKGEMGWYSYQDLMLIDGNTVRLWEGFRRRREAETTALWGGVVRTW